MKRIFLVLCVCLCSGQAMAANCVYTEKLSDGGRKNAFIKWVIVNGCGQTVAIRDINTKAVLHWVGSGQKVIAPRGSWYWTWN